MIIKKGILGITDYRILDKIESPILANFLGKLCDIGKKIRKAVEI
jgi:hypothetical protein